MAHRILNVSKQTVFVSSSSSSSSSPSSQTISERIAQLVSGGTVHISSGEYKENLIVPDNISLIGNGIVKINGDITFVTTNVIIKGNIISGIEFNNLTLNKSRLTCRECTLNEINLSNDSFLDARDCFINKITGEDSNFIIFNSSITQEGKTESDHCIKMRNLGNEIKGSSIQNCSLKGHTITEGKTAIEIRNCTVLSESVNYAFMITDPSTLQLFNSTVNTPDFIKNGTGTSIRNGVIAIGIGSMFGGGENIVYNNV